MLIVCYLHSFADICPLLSTVIRSSSLGSPELSHSQFPVAIDYPSETVMHTLHSNMDTPVKVSVRLVITFKEAMIPGFNLTRI